LAGRVKSVKGVGIAPGSARLGSGLLLGFVRGGWVGMEEEKRSGSGPGKEKLGR
jgi:hypothetical protein